MKDLLLSICIVTCCFIPSGCANKQEATIDYAYYCDYYWKNDTDASCIIKWSYPNYNKDIDQTVIIQEERIIIGDTYFYTGWYQYDSLFCGKTIEFEFDDGSCLSIDNPYSGNRDGQNWWDSLPNSTVEILSSKPLHIKKSFYLSDVLELAQKPSN